MVPMSIPSILERSMRQRWPEKKVREKPAYTIEPAAGSVIRKRLSASAVDQSQLDQPMRSLPAYLSFRFPFFQLYRPSARL